MIPIRFGQTQQLIQFEATNPRLRWTTTSTQDTYHNAFMLRESVQRHYVRGSPHRGKQLRTRRLVPDVVPRFPKSLKDTLKDARRHLKITKAEREGAGRRLLGDDGT